MHENNKETASASGLDSRIASQTPKLEAFLRKLAPHDFDDILQDVVVRALRYKNTFDTEGSLYGWLKKIAFHCYLDFQKKQNRGPGLLGDDVQSIEAPRVVDSIQDNEQVKQLLKSLTKIEADILIRFHLKDEKISCIARLLKIPDGTVKSHLHRARMKMGNIAERSADG